MVKGYAEVMADISGANNYDLVKHIRSYIEKNSLEYSPQEYDNLLESVTEKLDWFNPKNCMTVNEIVLQFPAVPSAPNTPMMMRFNKEKAISLCERSHQLDHDLPEWIERMYPKAITWYIDYVETAPQVKELTQRLENIVPTLTRKIQELEKGIPKVNIETQLDVARRFEALESDVERSLAEMNKRIVEAEKMKPQVAPSQPKPPSEFVTTMNASELNKFRSIMASKYPGRFFGVQSEKGGNTVSIPYADEKDLSEIKAVVDQAKESVRRVAPPVVRPPGFEDILHILCQTYERETGKSCGLSRTGALSTLASRIGEYAQDLGIDWQQLDIGSISLDAKPGQGVYRAEQADETYNRLVAQTSLRTIGQLESEGEAFQCDDEVIYPTFFDVYIWYQVQQQRTLTDKERKDLTDKLNILKNCGYTDSMFSEYIERTRGWFEDQHVEWDMLVDSELRNKLK